MRIHFSPLYNWAIQVATLQVKDYIGEYPGLVRTLSHWELIILGTRGPPPAHSGRAESGKLPKYMGWRADGNLFIIIFSVISKKKKTYSQLTAFYSTVHLKLIVFFIK